MLKFWHVKEILEITNSGSQTPLGHDQSFQEFICTIWINETVSKSLNQFFISILAVHYHLVFTGKLKHDLHTTLFDGLF